MNESKGSGDHRVADVNPNFPAYSQEAHQLKRGGVLYQLDIVLCVPGIRLEVNGYARVHWSEGAGKKRRSYNGHENFIELKTYLTGSGQL